MHAWSLPGEAQGRGGQHHCRPHPRTDRGDSERELRAGRERFLEGAELDDGDERNLEGAAASYRRALLFDPCWCPRW